MAYNCRAVNRVTLMMLLVCSIATPSWIGAQDREGYPSGRVGVGIGEGVGILNVPSGNPFVVGAYYLPHFNLRYPFTSAVALNLSFPIVDTVYWLMRHNPQLVLRGYDALLEVDFDPKSVFNPSFGLGVGPQVNTIKGFSLGLGFSAAAGGEYFFDPLISLGGTLKTGVGIKLLPLLPQIYWYGVVAGLNLNFYL